MASERSLESYRNQQKPTGRHTCVPGPVLASASGFGPQASPAVAKALGPGAVQASPAVALSLGPRLVPASLAVLQARGLVPAFQDLALGSTAGASPSGCRCGFKPRLWCWPLWL